MIRTAVFDLDGTLVDSAPDIHAALDRMAAARGFAPYSRAEVVAMIGDGVRKLVERALAARGQPFSNAALATFSADYTARAVEQTTLFPGIADAVAQLQCTGWQLAICTNKPAAATAAMLEQLGVASHFAAVGAGDSFPTKKPDPEHLRATLSAAGGRRERAVMIGDHRNDMVAARGLGIPAVFVRWGYGRPEMAEGAAALADAPADLPALLDRLMPA
jgi:phosphoglycolate phosphatase